MIYVCPNCQQSILEISKRCPSCALYFEPSYWPEEAYSIKGMIPQLNISWMNNHWIPTSNDFIIGRETGRNRLILSGQQVSRNHARVYCENQTWYVEKIKREIFLNSESVARAVLKPDDLLQIGPYLLKISITYVQKSLVAFNEGTLCTPEIEALNLKKNYIGSDPKSSRVIIDGADPKHALLYQHHFDDSWWIADCASTSGLKVNGERIRNKRLFPGDEVSIVGINFIFSENKILFNQENKKGLALSFSSVSAVAASGFQILDDISLSIASGEFIGVLGPSGSGKSSFIQRIVGLTDFTSGKMYINGQSFNSLPDAYLDAMAYLPQQNVLHSDLTLKEEFSCFRTLRAKQNKKIGEKTVKQVLRLVGLETEYEKRISALSGGEQRRAGMALALLRDPRLLVVDEPTSGLDPATETELMTYLKRISNQNKTVICSTHIMGNINLFDKVLILSKGKMVFWGTPAELLSFFNIKDPLKLYQIFASGDPKTQQDTAEEFARTFYNSSLAKKYSNFSPLAEELEKTKPALLYKQLYGYLKRSFFEFFSFKNTESKLKSFFGSAFFLQLFLQAFLIALVLKLSCAEKLCNELDRKEVLFFASAAIFWLGLNNSVRELVRERVPWRCLERLEKISSTIYLFSKLLWTSLLCFLQTLIFCVFLFELKFFTKTVSIIPFFQVHQSIEKPSFIFSFSTFLILLLVCIIGSWLGLAISAIFKKENAAVCLLPIIMFPVLFFSQPVMQNDNYNDVIRIGKDVKSFAITAAYIQKAMPCHYPQIVLDLLRGESNTDEKQANLHKPICRMLLNSSIYLIVSFIIIFYFQQKNEKEWSGR